MQKCKHLRALNGRMTVAGVEAANDRGRSTSSSSPSSHFMCEGCCSKMATTFLFSAVATSVCVSPRISVCALVFKMKVICQLITQLVVVPASSNARAQAQVISFGISSLLAFEWSHYEGGDVGGEGVAGGNLPACSRWQQLNSHFFSCSPRGMCRFCAAVYCQRWSKCF